MKIKPALFELLRRARRCRSPLLRPAVVLALCLATALTLPAQTPAPPVVTGVIAFQQMTNNVLGTNVTINYTLSDANFTSDNVFILVSPDAGNTWTVPALAFSGAEGTNISVSSTPTIKSVIWYASLDWPDNFTTNCRVRVLANNLGLVLIPLVIMTGATPWTGKATRPSIRSMSTPFTWTAPSSPAASGTWWCKVLQPVTDMASIIPAHSRPSPIPCRPSTGSAS